MGRSKGREVGCKTEGKIMTQEEIFSEIQFERHYQAARWSNEFDDANTPNDWVAYMVKYLGEAVTLPWDRAQFRQALVKVAALCFAALERETYAPRHCDVAALMGPR